MSESSATGVGRTSPPADGDERGPSAVARDLLVALRTGEPPDAHLSALAAFDDADLVPVREDRTTALAFWLNCYNAGTQLLLARRPGLYEGVLGTFRFFRAPALTVGGTALSLDAIEHGVLRGGRTKYGLGYLPKPFVSTFEHRYRLADVDPRAHFALNCGAESCPPIRAYEADQIDDQLDLATASHLQVTTEYDPDRDTLRVPRMFLWFRGDFGGAAGVRAFLREHGAVPAGADPSIEYLPWDWALDPGAFAETK